MGPPGQEIRAYFERVLARVRVVEARGAATAFDPENSVHTLRFHQKTKVLADVGHALLQPQRLFHATQPLQLTLHPVQRVGHRQVEIAVLLQELFALLKGHAAFCLETARPR